MEITCTDKAGEKRLYQLLVIRIVGYMDCWLYGLLVILIVGYMVVVICIVGFI